MLLNTAVVEVSKYLGSYHVHVHNPLESKQGARK